jgi:hypothetical protein
MYIAVVGLAHIVFTLTLRGASATGPDRVVAIDGCGVCRRRARRRSEGGGGRADSAGGAVYLQSTPAHGRVLPRAGLPLFPYPS